MVLILRKLLGFTGDKMKKKGNVIITKIVAFAMIIAGGVIVSFVPDINLKVLGGLLTSTGVALGSLT